jgi:hypothetical protein
MALWYSAGKRLNTKGEGDSFTNLIVTFVEKKLSRVPNYENKRGNVTLNAVTLAPACKCR